MSKIRIRIEWDVGTGELKISAPLNQTPHVVWLLELAKQSLLASPPKQSEIEVAKGLMVPRVKEN